MSIVLPVISKLLSESLLSLYPVFVKNINLPLTIQLLSRVVIYVVISAFFCNYSFIFKNLFSKWGIILGITTLIHIYASYRGFQLLESGIAYTLFYTYPIMIILLAGEKFTPFILLALLGVYLLSLEQLKQKHENFENENDKKQNEELKEKYKYEGFVMIFLAALTEAFIYFQVRNIKTDNNWNHVFISYFLGSIVMIFYTMFSENQILNEIDVKKRFGLALIINAIIGTLGYFFRFYAATRIGPLLYAILSYFGIFMSFIYGIIFNKEPITWKKTVGALLIILSNFYIMKKIH
jgi:drug/metabolite transporter (DMT)-like permease